MLMWKTRVFAAGALLGALPACKGVATPRPQAVVVVDTDSPVVAQLVGHPEISADAAIDTLLIEVLEDADGGGPQVIETQELILPDPADWPVSFGVAAPVDGSGGVRRIRLRAFQGQRALPDDCEGQSPPPGMTIDRLIDVPLPSSSVVYARVTLASDCRGLSTDLAGLSCVDAQQTQIRASAGVGVSSEPPDADSKLVGTWPRATETPCPATLPAAPGRICVPGGFTILGDEDLAYDTIDLGAGLSVSSCPVMPVIVSPFLMDRTEFTVGRFNELIEQAAISTGDLPQSPDITNDDDCLCTWLGVGDHTHDDLPLNCVSWDTASKVCKLVGGRLPTQAEWEHAARGRGQGRTFPWGNEAPTCCQTSFARSGGTACPQFQGACADAGNGIDPVASYPGGGRECHGRGDVSRDGILDLGGSLSEATLDTLTPYSQCWTSGGMEGGVAINPLCDKMDGTGHLAHGGNWSLGYTYAASASRTLWTPVAIDGFRCVYPEAP